jgi:hypothetical protein
LSESWRVPGPWDDSLRHRRPWSTGGRHNLRAPAQFDQQVWLHVVELLDGAAAHDRSEVGRVMDGAMALPKGRLIALKQTLRMGIWCNVTALVPSPVSDESLEQLAWRIYPATNSLLNVATDTLTSVMGDALRITDEEQASYPVKEGEFILVATVILTELLAIAPAVAADLDAIHDQRELAFSTMDTGVVQEAWLGRLASDP